MRMYIIFSVTFSGMLSQFLNSGKIGTFQSIDGRSGWSSLLLIKFFIIFAQQMKKFMVYIQIFFFCRHLYKPLLRRGVSKQVASVAVFATSAFFHEVCTGTLRLMPRTYWYIHSFEILFDMFNQTHVSTNFLCFLFSIYLVFL